jgi:biopolymer transport protein ExbB
MNALMTDASGALNMLIDKGGPTMIALGVLSVAVVAVFIARALALALSSTLSPALEAAARNAAELPEGPARAMLEAEAGAEAARLRAGFRFMELAATAAPLLGLLGTVLGMIEAFRQLEAAGTRVNPSLLAGGIWEALLTTAAGMVVALIALACLSIMEGLAERASARTERSVNAILAGSGAAR